MADGQAYIDVLPIPDRVDGDRLRLAVQMTPTQTERPGGTIDHANWSSQIVERVAWIGVWIAEIEDGKPVRPRWVDKFEPDIGSILKAPSMDPEKTIAQQASEKWAKIFLEADLARAIAMACARPPADALKLSAFEAVGAAPTSAIEDFLDDTYRGALARSVERRLRAADVSASKQLNGATYRQEPDVQPWTAIAERLDFSRAKAAVDQANAARAAQSTPLTSKISDSIWGKPSELERACEEQCRFIADMPAGMDVLLASASSGEAALRFDQALVETVMAVGADDGPDPMELPPAEVTPNSEELAIRKLTALLSFPTLAKYFGLCADVLIPTKKLLEMGTGLIAVEHRRKDESFPMEPDIDKLSWTAFVCRKRANALYFGPWQGPSETPVHAYADGLLNLTHKVGNTPRFQLGSEAALITLFRLGEKSFAIKGQIADGRLRPDDPKPLPDRTTKGIVLYDRFAKQVQAVKLLTGMQNSNVSFADQLCQGLRFDVQLVPVKKNKVPEWRPLMSRLVTYSLEDVDGNFLKDKRVRALAYRDDAIAVSAREEKDPRSIVLIELMQWAGGSLAVSTSQDPEDPAKSDIGIGIDFDLPTIADNGKLCPPPLRYGREYRVRARLALPLGCGMTFLDIESAGGFDDQVLPPPLSKEGKPQGGYAYKRYEAIGAPPVVLPWNSALATDPDPPAAPQKLQAGGTLEELVVRSSDTGKADVRYLLPARLALDVAEQQGQFDDGYDDDRRVPSGAFEDQLKVALYGPDGRLPDARLGAVTWYDQETKKFYADLPNTIESETIRGAQSRGEILIVNPRAMRRQRERYDNAERPPQPRYYPDRFARQAIARFLTVPGYSAVAGSKAVAFWGPRSKPRDALPAMIELKAGREHQQPARFTGSSTVEIRPPQGNGAVEIPNLTITLQPAEVVELEIFADCNQPGFAQSHHGRCIVQDLAKLNGDAAQVIRTLSADPLPQVTFSRKLRLVHAVERPIRAPGITTIKAVSLSVRPEESTSTVRKSWAEHVGNGDGGNLKSEEGGATTFFVGMMAAEARSSSQLRLDARWYGYGPNTIKLSPLNGEWFEDLPEEFAQLFKIDLNLGEDTVDLLREPPGFPSGKLRALGYAFNDGRARQLRLRPVATSRFTAYFPPEENTQELDGVGRYERAANDFSDAPKIWVDCTFRPPPPTVDRALPVFIWDNRRKSRDLFTFSRKSLIRIFLQPDWYASGEDEQLAVVFDTVERDVCVYEDEANSYSRFGRFVTRWGRDAIRKTPAVTNLGPQNVIRWGKEDEVTVGVPGKLYPGALDTPKQDDDSPLDVLVVPMKPDLDPQLGLYCDIELGVPKAKPGQFLPSYMPFVQLGLARYQEHAVDGLQLSRPIEHTVQLLPYRFGEVRVVGSSRIRVTVKGQSYSYAEGEKKFGPRLDVRILVREELAVLGPAPSNDFAWFPAERDGKEVVEKDIAPNEELADAVVWDLEIELPTRRNEAHYGVLIEEYEWLRGDPEDPKFVASRDDLFKGTVRTRRGPLFATTIDLGR